MTQGHRNNARGSESVGEVSRLSTTSRVETFSDEVIAIAITLLVLNVHLPESSNDGLTQQLLHLWPSYLAYIDSFLTVGVIWLCHHAFFSRIRHVDGLLQLGNLLLLLSVAFIPFPTAVLAEHLAAGGHDAAVAACFYGIVAMVQAAAWLVMWAALRRRPELFEPGYGADFARSESFVVDVHRGHRVLRRAQQRLAGHPPTGSSGPGGLTHGGGSAQMPMPRMAASG